MSSFFQHTLARPFELEGVGLHTGARVELTGRPAPANSGIVFHRTDQGRGDRRVAAEAGAVSDTRLGTTITNADAVGVATVEHLLAVCSGLAIDNLLIEIDGPEAPILDGSAEPFVAAFEAAGRRLQGSARRYIEVLQPIEVGDGERRAALLPCPRFEVAFEIAFDCPVIGRQRIDLAVGEDTFRRELADCRTFGFLKDVEALRAAGLARGGALDNVVVIGESGVLNGDGLRRADEFVRHKALDAVGDLYLLGAPLLARYEGRYAGHALNNALARRLLASPRRWRYVHLDQELALAV